MQFQPSRTSVRSEYGFWGAKGKARRRDRKLRRAGRRLTKYEECIEAGKGESKCEKYKTRGEKSLGKAKALDEKIAAKGKKTTSRKDRQSTFKKSRAGTLGMSEEEIAEAEAAGTLPSARRSGGMMSQGMGPAGGGGSAEDEFYDDEELAVEPAGGGGLLMGVAVLALLGGGFAFYKVRQGK